MKNKLYFTLILILAITIGSLLSQEIPQLIFYQGNLTNNSGNPVSEDKSMTFRIYAARSGGTKLWEETHSTVPIAEGLFSVMLGNQNPISINIFSAKTRFLEIVIGGETLSPRQRIASVPYAHSSASVSGSSNIIPCEGNVGIGTTSPQAKLDVEGRTFQIGSVVYQNGSSSGNAIISSNGVNTDLYPAKDDIGAVRVKDGNGSGALTMSNMGSSHIDSYLNVEDSTASNLVLQAKDGNVGIGTKNPLEKLEVAGTISSTIGGFKFPDGTVQTTAGGGGSGGIGGSGTAGRVPYFKDSSTLNNSDLHYANGNFGIGGNPEDANFYVHESGLIGPGITPPTYIARFQWGVLTQRHDVAYITSGGHAWFKNGVKGKTGGSDAKAIVGHATNSTNTSNYGGYFQADGYNGVGIWAKGGTNGYAGRFRGNVLITSWDTGAKVIELGEGLDYAEGFNVSDKKDIVPGSVLIIDPQNPGDLILSNKAYDSKVAGIVAGAKNLGSGVRLGVDQFDYDVALAGRVYCNVDATAQEIKPGDLLTTSSVPGFAMKVSDFQQAQGAVIGKAMEGLEKGQKGQILVLVTLQ